MHRYDRAWDRGYARPDRAPYDRMYRSGDGHWGEGGWSRGQSAGGGGNAPRPWGNPPPWGGWGSRHDVSGLRGEGYDGYRGYGGYDYHGQGAWKSAYDRTYRPYPPGRSGEGDRYRRQPWQGGPAGGYGSPWSEGYGGGGQPWAGRGGAWGYPRRRPHQRGYDAAPWAEVTGGWERYAEKWDFPRGYVDEGMESYFDDESDADFDSFDFDDEGGGDFEEAWWEEQPDDDEVRQRVLASLRSDGFLNADSVQVEVSDRVVTLRGRVGDYMEARYAWDDAWDAAGVRGVISKLEVAEAGRQESPPGAARKAASATSKGSTSSSGKKAGGKRKKKE